MLGNTLVHFLSESENVDINVLSVTLSTINKYNVLISEL